LVWRGWMSMLMRAAICGLNGAGSAFGSPNGLCAAVRPDHMATVTKTANAATTMPAMTRPRMTLILPRTHLWACRRPSIAPGEPPKHDWTPSRLDVLKRAFGLDRNSRIAARRRTSDDAELLVAWLVARDFDVLGINLLAEAWDLVGAEQVGARDDTAAVL